MNSMNINERKVLPYSQNSYFINIKESDVVKHHTIHYGQDLPMDAKINGWQWRKQNLQPQSTFSRHVLIRKGKIRLDSGAAWQTAPKQVAKVNITRGRDTGIADSWCAAASSTQQHLCGIFAKCTTSIQSWQNHHCRPRHRDLLQNSLSASWKCQDHEQQGETEDLLTTGGGTGAMETKGCGIGGGAAGTC